MTNFTEMLKDAMELGLTKEEAMSFVKDCLALTQTTTVGGKATKPKTGTGAKAPKAKTEEAKKPEKKEFDIEDVKFDKYNDGNCNWSYYKEVRKAYCYRRQGCKVWKGTVTKPEGFVFDETKWEADKKAFEAKYPYIKKSDRK
jgi:hypothetical protein